MEVTFSHLSFGTYNIHHGYSNVRDIRINQSSGLCTMGRRKKMGFEHRRYWNEIVLIRSFLVGLELDIIPFTRYQSSTLELISMIVMLKCAFGIKEWAYGKLCKVKKVM